MIYSDGHVIYSDGIISFTVSEAMEMAQSELLPQTFHIPSSQIKLLNSIGHGRTSEAVIILYHKFMSFSLPCSIPAGEFSEVYKARLRRRRGTCIVAVKTIRGRQCVHCPSTGDI